MAINKEALSTLFRDVIPYIVRINLFERSVSRGKGKFRRCYLEISPGVQSSRLERVMGVILEIDINESYAFGSWFIKIYYFLVAFIEPRSSTRKIGRFDELISICVNKANLIAAAASRARQMNLFAEVREWTALLIKF